MANQERQRQKGIIGASYRLGQQRLGLQQGDTRQSYGESLLARGLGNAGGVRDTGAVGPGTVPGVGGAHDLGSQGVADLAREQTLEQNALKQQKDNALSDLNANYTQSLVGSVAAGVGLGVNVATGLGGAGAAAGGSKIAAAMGGTSVAGSPSDAGAKPSTGWGGIDPVSPFTAPGSAWNTSTRPVDSFNVYG